MGARRFAPGPARFLQRDALTSPAGELALTGSLLNANRYALAAGNPLGYVEQDGHWVADVDPNGETQPLRNHFLFLARSPVFWPISLGLV